MFSVSDLKLFKEKQREIPKIAPKFKITNLTAKIPDCGAPMEAGSIKAIDKGSVHRICSGQVVLTLATAVKELVENSIDAGASIVDIKLKEYGSEVIEVSDNGSGVEEKNFEGLTLKHHTSKLEDFSDLINVETFGFRGEALSSLCALSDLCIVTRHKDVEVGTKLEYDHHGNITSRSSVARQIGTTTTLQNLFYTLPVRHKEFHRNLKKEFVKMVQVLNAYCLINTRVRITCTNQTGKGNRTTVVSSKGNPTIKENISNIFGPKQIQSLMEFSQCKPTEEISTEYGLKSADGMTDLFKIEGYISTCEHGQGRSSADRQFYFINKRPCDHSKLSKLVNEVYHQFNRHQYPFVSISITMCRESVDVNVTPDKRQLFIENEKILLAVIKTSLIQMYEPTVNMYNINTIGNTFKKSPFKQRVDDGSKEDTTLSKPSITSTLSILKRSFSSSFSKEEDHCVSHVEERSKQRKLDTFIVKSNTIESHTEEDDNNIKPICEPEITVSSHLNTSVVFETHKTLELKSESSCKSDDSCILNCEQREIITTDSESGISSSQDLADSQSSSSYNTISSDSDLLHHSQELIQGHSPNSKIKMETCLNLVLDKTKDVFNETGSFINESQLYKDKMLPTTDCVQVRNVENEGNLLTTDCVQVRNVENEGNLLATDCVQVRNDEVDGSSFTTDCVQPSNMYDETDENYKVTEVISVDSPSKNNNLQVTCFDEKQIKTRTEKMVQFDIKSFREKVKKHKTRCKNGENFCRTFRAKISPTDNKSAEEELQKEIKKDMFSQMDILGQFNLGFIITKFKDDLFIVDQHATDEKYNFEMLQKHTVIQSQRLIQPQNLELTSSNEIILMESIEVFRKNGFDFVVNEENDPTQRVKLISTPVSKNWTFGKDDIEELIFMLTDSPGVMCRPSRVRQMFASRSCRKSIMIGTALNKSEMKKLVDHMGQIDQPWNCPHGRPTMRHLINLNMVPR